MFAGDRDAGGMDLGEAGVREKSAALVRAEGRVHAGADGVGGQEKDVGVSARAEADRVGGIGLDLAGHEIPHRDALGLAVHDHEVQHLRPGMERDGADLHLAQERAVSAEQELLARLAARIEGARDLRAAEGAGGEIARVVPGKRHALGNGLVDDVAAQLREAVDVRLAGPEVAALDRVVEQALDAVAVVGIVLGRVDAALGRDAVGAAGRVLEDRRRPRCSPVRRATRRPTRRQGPCRPR